MRNEFVIVLLCFFLTCQATELVSTTSHDGHPLKGHLSGPNESQHVVLFVAGSGPTDHNGNQPQMQSNAYLMIANALNEQGITVLRYDKRGIGENAFADFDMSKTSIHDYAKDVAIWGKWLKTKYPKVTMAGHSLGGMLIMMAQEQVQADQLILLASIASPSLKTLQRQLKAQPEFVSKPALVLLERLNNNEDIPLSDVPPFLHNLFHPNLQYFLRSFLNIDPRELLTPIKQPVLAIIGDTDLQITIEETQKLVEGITTTKVINGMNHVLKEAPEEHMANTMTYYQPDLPLHPELIPVMIAFLKPE